ncbi:MAG: right-handed parallel beta-helix repeat-containing protein [Polyangiaceae bacterium]
MALSSSASRQPSRLQPPADGGAGTDSGAGCATGAWPTAATTGIPAGTPTLTKINASLHTKQDGQVFDAVELNARLYVDHKNVVIKRSRLVGDQFYAVYVTIPAASLTVEDCEIVGGMEVQSDGFTARRNHVHAPAGGNKNDGIFFGGSGALIEDNYIAGLHGGPGAHVDGIQPTSGKGIVIRHNWIEINNNNDPAALINAAIFFQPSKGPLADLTVECNMLNQTAGFWPLRFESGITGPIVVRGNRWAKGFQPSGPAYVKGSTTVTTWQDNAYVDGTPISGPTKI